MSPSFMPAIARVSSMRPRRRATRSARRQLRREREFRLRGSVWLQSQSGDNYNEEPHLSSDSISENERKTPSPLHNSSSFDHRPIKDPNYTADYLTSEKSANNRLLLLQRRDGLINITIRTMKLMRRNQQLQQRLAQLQAETRAFVRSVMNNPENQGLRLTTASMLLDKRQDSTENKNDDDSSSCISSLMETQDEQEDSFISESGESSAAEK